MKKSDKCPVCKEPLQNISGRMRCMSCGYSNNAVQNGDDGNPAEAFFQEEKRRKGKKGVITISVVTAILAWILIIGNYFWMEKHDPSKKSGKYESIEEYVESAEVQITLRELKQNNSEGMNIEVSGKGNRLIYTYTYSMVFDENQINMMKVYFENRMNSEDMVTNFSNIAKTLSAYIDVKNPIVVVEYRDGNGTLIYSTEYK